MERLLGRRDYGQQKRVTLSAQGYFRKGVPRLISSSGEAQKKRAARGRSINVCEAWINRARNISRGGGTRALLTGNFGQNPSVGRKEKKLAGVKKALRRTDPHS